MITWKK